jgi:hypothetical protein
LSAGSLEIVESDRTLLGVVFWVSARCNGGLGMVFL